MLSPKFRDVDLGRAEVRQVYKISNVGTVAGCYVLEGKITRARISAWCATVLSLPTISWRA
jgi:translation initiation factor IF-2